LKELDYSVSARQQGISDGTNQSKIRWSRNNQGSSGLFWNCSSEKNSSDVFGFHQTARDVIGDYNVEGEGKGGGKHGERKRKSETVIKNLVSIYAG
jgi:hypothetical protein